MPTENVNYDALAAGVGYTTKFSSTSTLLDSRSGANLFVFGVSLCALCFNTITWIMRKLLYKVLNPFSHSLTRSLPRLWCVRIECTVESTWRMRPPNTFTPAHCTHEIHDFVFGIWRLRRRCTWSRLNTSKHKWIPQQIGYLFHHFIIHLVAVCNVIIGPTACGEFKIHRFCVTACDVAKIELWYANAQYGVVDDRVFAVSFAKSNGGLGPSKHTAWDHSNRECSKRCHQIEVNRPVNVQQFFLRQFKRWVDARRLVCDSLKLFNFVLFSIWASVNFVVMKWEIVRFLFVCWCCTGRNNSNADCCDNKLSRRGVSVHFANIRLWSR